MPDTLSILVVDDDISHADVVVASLEKLNADCVVAHSQREALSKAGSQYFDVIITDLMLENQDSGIELLKAVKQISEETEIIVMTAHNSIEKAVEAMRSGAFNYLQKPLDLKQLRTITERAAESSQLRRINRELKQRLDEKFGFNGVVGNSPQMLAIIDRLKRVASTDVTVLIQGETGTGKELFAQATHQNSPRKNKPFVALNCGALSENILESEFFGHVKGAFTGALADRIGKFEYASGGTIFLDEIGDMPTSTQVKLLRVLENGEITRVGSNNTINVNVRILSATNRNLEEAIEAGTFRQDLYHRLKVVTLRIPPLRERKMDIPVLLDHFLKYFSDRYGKKIKGITQRVRKILFGYDWFGNVRQLRNVAESMLVVDYDGIIDIDDLPEELGGVLTFSGNENENIGGDGNSNSSNVEKNMSGDQLSSVSDLSSDTAIAVNFGSGLYSGSCSGLGSGSDLGLDSESDLDSESGLVSGLSSGDVRVLSAAEGSELVTKLAGKSMAEIERIAIMQTLEMVDGNREEAAGILGIGERTLYRKIKEYTGS
ncbi:MAG: sigma-54 dependent transcriptional regulator [Planctomycetaceae bacterium]|nr:sigma-54 dependent transcriptional regulator [Planctomycetaceae bacterium]